MSKLGTVLKVGILAKVAQLVQREASKPENRKKATDALNKYKSRRAAGTDRPAT